MWRQKSYNKLWQIRLGSAPSRWVHMEEDMTKKLRARGKAQAREGQWALISSKTRM